jgi:hypothetical protein
MIEKQIPGENISVDDEEFVRTLLSGWQIKLKSDKQLTIGERNEKKAYVLEDISALKLILMTHKTTTGVKIFVGPSVFHKESR